MGDRQGVTEALGPDESACRLQELLQLGQHAVGVQAPQAEAVRVAHLHDAGEERGVGGACVGQHDDQQAAAAEVRLQHHGVV